MPKLPRYRVLNINRQKHRSTPSVERLLKRLSLRNSWTQWLQTLPQKVLPPGGNCQQCSSRNSKNPNLILIFLIAIISLTAAAGYPFYNQPLLKEGAIAPETVLAPQTAEILNFAATEAQRQAKRLGLIPVLIVDNSLNQEITEDLANKIDLIDEIRAIAGSFPFTSTGILSTSTQTYLSQASSESWERILKYSDYGAQIKVDAAESMAIADLFNYKRSRSAAEVNNLINSIQSRRDRYRQAIAKIFPPILPAVLDLSDSDWEVTKVGLLQVNERILAQGIPRGLSNATLESAIAVQLSPILSATARQVSTELLLNSLKPNLITDTAATQRQMEQAANQVNPVFISVKQGDRVVARGEKISESEFLVLEYFGLSRRSINWSGLFGFTAIIAAAISLFIVAERKIRIDARSKPLRQRDYGLILLLSLTTPLLSQLGAYYTNLIAVGWLIGSFYHPVLATAVISLLAGLTIATLKVSWDYLVASTVAGIIAAHWAGKMRSREELAFLGAGVVVTQATVYFLLRFIAYGSRGAIGYLFIDALRSSAPALGWSIFALGISPYLEHLFDLITPIRLVELANPNRPLLKRLAAETPGTFQHTIFVANLAEAAARELGLNVELVRTGTLYHDIGKMHDPMGFIENQMGGVNKHDEIKNPWKSAQIIKKHVSEGLVMARKYRLPKAIQAFIPEHQGTIQIAYFYHQARQLAAGNPGIAVNEADFRYAGPIPQSPETAVVMLADACEAALRSLKDAPPDTALMTIKKILHARWQEGQLIDSGLTKEQMPKIADTFLEVWKQSNHQRIVYPSQSK